MKKDSRAWLSSALDSIEFEESSGELHNVEVLPEGTAVTRAITKRYFSKNLYPYAERLSARRYLEEKYLLQIELVKLQNWVVDSGARIVIIFEGRDAAGKGSTIKRFMEHLNPRASRVVALEKPTDVERSQWYFQRYVAHLPTAGEIVFFDRSWYNRAGVERVMGFCTKQEYEDFVEHTPLFEKMLTKSGIHLIKFYLSVSRSEQQARFAERAENPLKQWKLSPIDQEAQTRWDDYTSAKEETFRRTDTDHAPWVILKSEDKLRARLEAIRFVLSQFEYEDKSEDAVGQPDPLLLAKVSDLNRFGDD